VGRPLSSSERAGRAIYQAQQCAGCHIINGEGGSLGPDLTSVGSRRSAGWIHSYIEQPNRFLENSMMPPFGPPTLTHQEIEELAHYVASLRGPPGREVPQEIHDTFP
jgi:mono/diheme cytochrome c family protein